MKKFLPLICAMLFITSCTKGTDHLSRESQLKLISENQNIWITDFDSFDPVSYTVCDLNDNGRLEIIAASIQGTGFYTSYNIFEVSGDGKELIKYKNAASEGDSLADISWSDTVSTYKDPDTGIYHAAFTDYVKNGAAYYYEEKRDVVLSDYTVKESPIAYKITEYQDPETDPAVTAAMFTSGGEEAIAEKEYDSAFDTYFEGYEKNEVKLNWISTSEYDFDKLGSSEIYNLFS